MLADLVCVLLAIASPAAALDSTLSHVIQAGHPPGPAPMDRVDARRSSIAPVRLPRRPAVSWQARLPGTILFSPVASAGQIVFTTRNGHLVELDTSGTTTGSVRLGTPPVASPVITSDAARVVMTERGELYRVNAEGHIIWHRTIASQGETVEAPLLALDDGSVLLAVSHRLIQIEPTGQVRASVEIDEPALDLLHTPLGIIVVQKSGTVLQWPVPGRPQRLGRLGGRPAGGVTATPEGHLLAVVGAHRVVELNGRTGERHIRARFQGAELMGPPVVFSSGATVTKTSQAALLFFDRAGRETRRIALGSPRRRARSDGTTQAPLLVADRQGAVAYAAAGGLAGVVDPRGSVQPVSDLTCPDPVGLTPIGSEALILTCRSGRVWMLAKARSEGASGG